MKRLIIAIVVVTLLIPLTARAEVVTTYLVKGFPNIYDAVQELPNLAPKQRNAARIFPNLDSEVIECTYDSEPPSLNQACFPGVPAWILVYPIEIHR